MRISDWSSDVCSSDLYTSPHLLDFRERIRINGEMIPERRVVAFVNAQKKLIEALEPSFFEVTVAMAFDYFACEKVDFAVIEVGMGGRLDSTNIITPELSVITNIGLDHVHILGGTLPAIAQEKAGIIKQNTPVIIGEYQEVTAPVFREQARKMEAPLRFVSRDWELGRQAANDVLMEFTAISEHYGRSEEHTSELQSLMRISYAVFCLKKKRSIYRNEW